MPRNKHQICFFPWFSFGKLRDCNGNIRDARSPHGCKKISDVFSVNSIPTPPFKSNSLQPFFKQEVVTFSSAILSAANPAYSGDVSKTWTIFFYSPFTDSMLWRDIMILFM